MPILVGTSRNNGKPVFLTQEKLTRHMLMTGPGDSGGTQLGALMACQHIANGNGVFMIGYENAEFCYQITEQAIRSGRENDLIIINPQNPNYSKSYNPVLSGDPEDIADKLMMLIPDPHSVSSDFYLARLLQGMTVIIAAMQSIQMPCTPERLLDFISSPDRLLWLKSALEEDDEAPQSVELTNLTIFIDAYREVKNGTSQLHEKYLAETFAPMTARLHPIATGNYGKLTNTENPGLDLMDAMNNEKIILFSIPSNSDGNKFANLVVGDLRNTITERLFNRNKEAEPVFCYFDRLLSYANPCWNRLVEQSRSARCMLAINIDTQNENLSEINENSISNAHIKLDFNSNTSGEPAHKGVAIITIENNYLDTIAIMESTF